MKPLTIEIHGTGTHNRGAELMAIAIAERMRTSFPGVRLVVSSRFGSRDEIHRHGLLVSWEFTNRFTGRLKTALASIFWKNRRGVANPRDVDVVLDASGFAYSDQWGVNPSRRIVRMMSRPYRRKQVLVLLPQALGPFSQRSVAEWGRRLLMRAELVCARDSRSYAFARNLADVPGLRKFPDFTCGVAALLPESYKLPQKFCAIVPNFRMLDRTSRGEEYLRFLLRAVEITRRRNLNPVFVLHDAKEDRKVLEHLGDRVGYCKVLTHADPRVLKGILGRADFVIGSRFHALVSALSQGVPCIGVGWTHKYAELFRDLSCGEFLVDDPANLAMLEAAVVRLADQEERVTAAASILRAVDVMTEQNNRMWEEVEEIVRLAFDQARPVRAER